MYTEANTLALEREVVGDFNRQGNPRSVYWFAYVIDRGDPQKHLVNCRHRHRTWAQAEKCSRRLKKEFLSKCRK